MSEFERMVPKDRAQLQDNLDKLFKGRSHVKSVTVDDVNGFILIDLDGSANMFGNPDMKLPIKRSKITTAQGIVAELSSAFKSAKPPTSAEVDRLWELIDPTH